MYCITVQLQPNIVLEFSSYVLLSELSQHSVYLFMHFANPGKAFRVLILITIITINIIAQTCVRKIMITFLVFQQNASFSKGVIITNMFLKAWSSLL
jgi:hypothetical protein